MKRLLIIVVAGLCVFSTIISAQIRELLSPLFMAAISPRRFPT